MFSLTSNYQFYCYNQAIDIRKSFDSLCGLVQQEFKQDPSNGHVFLFLNKRCNQMKLLQWQAGGFVIYYKRLETGIFKFSELKNNDIVCSIKWADLVFLIEGITAKEITYQKRFSLNREVQRN